MGKGYCPLTLKKESCCKMCFSVVHLPLDCQWLVFLFWHFSLCPASAGSQHRRCWNVLWFHEAGRTTTDLQSMYLLLSWTTCKSSLCLHNTYQRSTPSWRSFSKLTPSKEEAKMVGIECRWHECHQLSHSELSFRLWFPAGGSCCQQTWKMY